MTAIAIEDLARFFRQDSLELTILPTEGCNLRCTYCYVDHKALVMPAEVVSGIKALMRRRAPELSFLRIGWFGGEPLICKDIVLDISSFAFSLSRDYPRLDFQGGMSTNACFLDLPTMASLSSFNINRFQVSLDGPRHYHDTLRVRPDGSGSFDAIWANLLALRDSSLSFSIILRLHISRDNIHLMPDFLAEITDTFGGDSRFEVFFKALAPLSGKDDGIAYFGLEEQDEIRNQLSGILSQRLAETEGTRCDEEYVCYAARPTAFVVRPDGSLVKCTVGLDDADNQIGKLYEDGRMQVDQEKFRRWTEGTARLDKDFMRCPRQAIIRSADH
ncbi:MAG: radical SAM protein [Bacteroidales bacterium]|nr:radical SAM protein [Bacteroidales bacterium]